MNVKQILRNVERPKGRIGTSLAEARKVFSYLGIKNTDFPLSLDANFSFVQGF